MSRPGWTARPGRVAAALALAAVLAVPPAGPPAAAAGPATGHGPGAAVGRAGPAGPPAGAPLDVPPGPVAEPAVRARGALLVDEATGQTLLARSPRRPLPMASTTKVMTALLTLEALPPERVVTVGAEPGAVRENALGLRPGEHLTVRQLLLGLLLSSANDAAVALADAVDGSEAAFVRHMNRRAAELRLTDTRYVTSHGLDRPGHHTSARDLARLWEVAMRHPAFRTIVRTHRARIPGRAGPRALETTDHLLRSYPWTVGGKTGYTRLAGRCRWRRPPR